MKNTLANSTMPQLQNLEFYSFFQEAELALKPFQSRNL
jgi:hypothetical protein